MLDQIDAAVRRGGRVRAAAAVVVAHPDDETLWLSAALGAFSDLTLAHLTDGAPEDMADARRAGFSTRGGYAAARAQELNRALDALGVRPRRRLSYDITDQAAVHALPELTRRLADDLLAADVVVTHAYEGGHPDHDAAAFAVQQACRLLRKQGGRAPLRLEFAGYHAQAGRWVAGRFPPGADGCELELRLAGEALARKRRAASCFASQAPVVERLFVEAERLRLAPEYDFDRPPASGEALYDQFGWRLTSAAWRDLARGTAAALEGQPCQPA